MKRTIYTPPVTKRAKTKASKTSTARLTKYGVPRSVKVFGKGAFPATLQSTLKYADIATVAVTSGFGVVRYRANSIYDPLADTGGHQPMYFDQLMEIYNHFHVVRSVIKVTPLEGNYDSAGLIHPGYVAILLDDDASYTFSNASQALEHPNVVVKSFGASTPTALWSTFDTYKVFGRGAMSNPDLQGNSSTDCSEQQVYHVLVHDADLANRSTQLMVQIEYEVIFSELKNISQS